ncbi:MAG: CsbD family protein [Isosphaeraceae bacterium]
MAINVQGLQGHWNQLKGELMKRWGELSEDDLKWSGGNIDQLVGRIQQRTGETRESIEKYLDQLTSQGSSAVSSAVESVGSYAQEVSHRLRDHYGDISEHAREGYVSARDVVGRNPVPWIGLAFGIGVLTGVLMGGSIGGSSSHRRYF